MKNSKSLVLHLVYVLFALALLHCTGCEKSPEIAPVRGVVTLDGKPLDTVRVLFMPDPAAGNAGAHSECLTGEDGSFDLMYSQAADVQGAIVGAHRVVIEDTAAEEARGKFRPIRVPRAYRSAASTPLRLEVKPGEQTIDIELTAKIR